MNDYNFISTKELFLRDAGKQNHNKYYLIPATQFVK